MVTTNNFHLVVSEAMASNSMVNLMELIMNLTSREDAEYSIFGYELIGGGGFATKITYPMSGRTIYGGLVRHGDKWQIHT